MQLLETEFNIQMQWSEIDESKIKKNESMYVCCTCILFGGSAMARDFLGTLWGPLLPIEPHWNSTSYLLIVLTMSIAPNDDRVLIVCQSDCLKDKTEFTVFHWPPKLPDLNPTERLWDCNEGVLRIYYVYFEEWMLFWKQKGAQPHTDKQYIIKGL